MKKSEIEEQLSNAEIASVEAINRYDAARQSVDELISQSKNLVDERSKSLEKSKEEQNQAKATVGSLKITFRHATSKLDSKNAEYKCTINAICYLENCYKNYLGQYQAAYLETEHLRTMLDNPSNTASQRAKLQADIHASSQAAANYHQKAEACFNAMCKKKDKLPKVEQQIKEFEKIVSEVKPKLDDANRKLEEANERAKRAEELFHEANSIMEHNQELGQAKLREAEYEKDRAAQLVSYWKSALTSAQWTFIDYSSKQYD